jgi:DNA-binding HxlR family transcriptional regulator
MGVLAKKWSLLLLREAAGSGRARFTGFLGVHARLSRRVLSLRLLELQEEGYLEKVVSVTEPRRTAYLLTPKGRDAVRLLDAYADLVDRYRSAPPSGVGAGPSTRERVPPAARTIGPVAPVERSPARTSAAPSFRSRCERCAAGLPALAEAYVCSLGCTWCPRCARELRGRCPNCGGSLRLRMPPTFPRRAVSRPGARG